MEARASSAGSERRLPDWPAAAVSGLAAGAILMVLEVLWATMYTDESPWIISRMIGAIALGPETLQSTEFSVRVVTLALITHYALGVVFGLILGAVIAPFHLDSSVTRVLLTGAVFSLALYLLNFYVMVNLFPWFAELRSGTTLVAHLIFGMSAAYIYYKLDRHPSKQ